MKVWVVHHTDYGEIEIWSESTNILNTPIVESELDLLGPDYENEREEFVRTIENIKTKSPRVVAYIEERLEVWLEEIRGL